jgi:uncharacterized protein (TIGR03435 family)
MRKLSFRGKLLLGASGLLAVAVPAVLGVVSGAQLSAQVLHASGPLPAFEVASITLNKSGGGGLKITPDGLSVTGFPLHWILLQAFQVPEDQILGDPDWTRSDRYDIEAKVGAGDLPLFEKLTPEQHWAMLVPLLQDRFGLKFHHETRNLQVYALVIAKGGPKLRPAKPEGGAQRWGCCACPRKE